MNMIGKIVCGTLAVLLVGSVLLLVGCALYLKDKEETYGSKDA